MSDSQQDAAIRGYFSDKGENDPAGGAVLVAKGSANLYCNTIGTASDPIKNIDG